MHSEKQNTDRTLWCENHDDPYSPTIFVTRGGGIGIAVGGNVIVQNVRGWHRDASEKLGQSNDEITRLRAENARLQEALEAWNTAVVRVDALMDGPRPILSPVKTRHAWELTCAALQPQEDMQRPASGEAEKKRG